MKGYFDDIGDAVRYALGDKYAILIIGVIVGVASFVNKSAIFPSPIMRVLNVFLLIEVVYGSSISWYTLKGSDELPKIANIKKLAWEGSGSPASYLSTEYFCQHSLVPVNRLMPMETIC